MDEARKTRYERLLKDTREDIKGIDDQVERELAEVKVRLAGLQSEKEAQLIVYDGYCRLLGVSNEFSGEEELEEDLD